MFDDARLPVGVERGARGGPGFKTRISPLTSGREKRNQDWAVSRGSWDISYGLRNLEKGVIDEVRQFFYERRGQARSFRFKDWGDYTHRSLSNTDPMGFAAGDGSETVFQLTKQYGQLNPYVRTITKPIDNTVYTDSVPLLIYVDDIAASFTCDYSTGIVTMDVAPADGAILTWTGEFDCHVRFNKDNLDVALQTARAGSTGSIPLIELKS